MLFQKSFYFSFQQVEGTVRGGPNAPGVLLDHFLQTMSRLKHALDYFELNNPQSIELENVRTLYELGGDALSREFSELVKKYSKAVPPLDILNSVDNDLASPRSASAGGKEVIISEVLQVLLKY